MVEELTAGRVEKSICDFSYYMVIVTTRLQKTVCKCDAQNMNVIGVDGIANFVEAYIWWLDYCNKQQKHSLGNIYNYTDYDVVCINKLLLVYCVRFFSSDIIQYT